VRAHARAEFARLAYLRAVADARGEPTPARWSRLLRAAQNLRSAVADREREERAGGWRGRAPRTSAQVHVASGTFERREPGPEPDRVVVAPAESPQAPEGGPRWPELDAELVRAESLVAKSRRLVDEARALRDDLRRALAAWAAIRLHRRPGDPAPAGTPWSGVPPRA
jgi:hypothetical protein